MSRHKLYLNDSDIHLINDCVRNYSKEFNESVPAKFQKYCTLNSKIDSLASKLKDQLNNY